MSLFSEDDVDSFRSDRLALVQSQYFPEATFTDEYLLGQIQAAEQDVGLALKVPLEPTTIFPYPVTQAQIDGLSGAPYIEEPGYDYDPEFFRNERWGYIVTRQKPIISVTSINLVYPAPTSQVFQIPQDWLRIDKKYGHIRMVPASSTFVAPLGAFLMQALSGGAQIPSMIQVIYVAGLTDAKDKWPAVIDVILKRAVQKVMKGSFLPGSASISGDGLSQSLSLKIKDFEDDYQTALFGDKGSNGGLWSAIHGIQVGIAGVTA